MLGWLTSIYQRDWSHQPVIILENEPALISLFMLIIMIIISWLIHPSFWMQCEHVWTITNQRTCGMMSWVLNEEQLGNMRCHEIKCLNYYVWSRVEVWSVWCLAKRYPLSSNECNTPEWRSTLFDPPPRTFLKTNQCWIEVCAFFLRDQDWASK